MRYSIIQRMEISVCNLCNRFTKKCDRCAGKFKFNEEIICDFRKHYHHKC